MNPSKNSLKWCWLSLIIVMLDQLSKYLVTHSLTLYQSVVVCPFFNLTLLHNTGAAFSFLHQHPMLALWLFSGIALIMSLVLVFWLRRLPNERRWQSCALALVLGGAIGNVIDRLSYGYVIDFLDLYYQTWHFAAFNIADSAISIGATMLLLEIFFHKKAAGENRGKNLT